MKFLVLLSVVACAAAGLVEHPGGAITPAETPAVAAARAAHLAAKGYALPYALNAYAPALPYAAGLPYAPALPYAGAALPYAAGAALPYLNNYAYNPYPYYGGLVSYPNGAVTPVDEPAVQAARAEHLAAKGLPLANAYAAYAPYAGYAPAYAPGLVAYPNGAVVPVDEPAVAAARKEHLAALAAAA